MFLKQAASSGFPFILRFIGLHTVTGKALPVVCTHDANYLSLKRIIINLDILLCVTGYKRCKGDGPCWLANHSVAR